MIISRPSTLFDDSFSDPPRPLFGRPFVSIFLVGPALGRGVLLVQVDLSGVGGVLQLLGERVRRLIDRITLSLSDAVHRQEVDLKILLGLELLVANVTRYVLGLHGVHVDDVLFQVRIVRVYFAALGTLGFATEGTRVRRLLLLVMVGFAYLVQHTAHSTVELLLMMMLLLLLMLLRLLLLLLFRARGQHDVQLVGRALDQTARTAAGRDLLLERVQIVLQLLMHGAQLLAVQCVQRVDRAERRGAVAAAVVAGVLTLETMLMVRLMVTRRRRRRGEILLRTSVDARMGSGEVASRCAR